MAPTDYNRRRNNKLEAFLQRTLPNEEYLRIRAYSPCIVNSSVESLTFRNVIITEDRVYLTENPPRTVYTAVNLTDVVAIRVIDEYPWFLRGEDREKCQHIEVVCKTLGNVDKLRKQPIKSASEQDMRDVGAGDGKSWRKLVKVLHRPVTRSKSDDSSPDVSVEVQDEQLETMSDRIITQSMPTLFNNSSPLSSANGRVTPQSHSFPSSNLSTIGRVPSLTSPGFLLSEDDEYENANGSGEISPRLYSRSTHHNDTLLKPATSHDSVLSSEFSQSDEIPSEFSSLETWPRNAARKFFQTKSQSALDHYPSQWRSPSVFPVPRSKSTSDAHFQPRSMQFHPAAADSISPALRNHAKKMKNEILNLYILDPNSLITSSLFTVWDNYMIRATLALDDVECADNVTKFNKSELLEKLLDELQHELADSNNNLEELFHLLQELKVAATKHKVLRRLFWKDSSLAQFMVLQLRKLLPNTNVSANDEDMLENREDELELTILILNTLSVMFRETEVVTLRWQHLTANKNKLLRELVSVISSCPKVPLQYLHTTQRMLTSFKEFFSSGWENLPESEFIKVLCEVTNACVALLFEIFFASKQVSSNHSSVVTVCGYLTKSSTAADSFWSHMMTQLLALLMSASQQSLQPQQVVLLYQHLYVLNIVLNHSQKLNASLTYDYNEEFRYYVHPEIITSQIPEKYPIKDAVVQLLHDIKEKIARKQFLLSKLHELR